MPKPPIKRVSAKLLCTMFNEGQYWEEAQKGILKTRVLADKHPSPPRAREPVCTRSQYVIYLDKNGKKVAGVHQYLRRDGTIGASGRPDPKELLVDGTLYMLEHT
jgi:hypothetical protein